ncbi:inositol monophosphatase family protein [Metapseudomonas otitidis]
MPRIAPKQFLVAPNLTEYPINSAVLLNKVTNVVLSAGKLLFAEWERPEGPRGQGDKADVDLEIEIILRKELLNCLDCDYWGEETGSRLNGHSFCWVVDPNDGTSDFLKGHRGSAISVGLLRNQVPVLGVVYAPVTNDRGPDCISWVEGSKGVIRNGQLVTYRLDQLSLNQASKVLMSTAATNKPELNAELCAPADFCPMPSIAYRLARVSVGDAIAGVSLVPVSAHDVVAGHALLIGSGGALLDQSGKSVTYGPGISFSRVADRCFGGAPNACINLSQRHWERLFKCSGLLMPAPI